MRLALALGVAFGALTLTAYAQPEERAQHRVFIQSHGGHDIDANDDGYITRAEMIAGADRMFGDMDRNDDGRLNDADHPPMEEFHRRIEAGHGDGDHVIRIEREGSENGERVVRVFRNGEEVRHGHGADDGERHVERHVDRRVERTEGDDDRDVIVLRGDGGAWTHAMPPLPPHPPMLMFASNNIEEFDRNNDGALSQEEFRAQQLAQFDAQDGNRDGRIRAMRPPEPPTPPEAPRPPEPPRRR